MNIFDILGPVMVGPSSSHTAGAVRIGLMARKLLGAPLREAQILLHGSFAATGKGHGTDRALVAGLLGMEPDDMRIPDSFSAAREAGLLFSFGTVELKGAHPNTAVLKVKGIHGESLTMQASSLGGGRIMIDKLDGMEVKCSCGCPTLVVYNLDQPGCVAQVTSHLFDQRINIANMSLYRNKKGGQAVMILELDQEVPASFLKWLKTLPGVERSIYIQAGGS
ncbi:MAG: L-serine ammonia-lyase, iron-sulfur-dependent subunit beta [Blautia sp.]|jgi:L-serine dehydratase